MNTPWMHLVRVGLAAGAILAGGCASRGPDASVLASADPPAAVAGDRQPLPPDRDNRSIPAWHDLPESDATVLPTTDCGGYFLVQTTINGRGPFNFVLDTGATHTAVSPRLARELGLESTKIQGVLRGVDGAREKELGVVTIDRLSAGDWALRDMDALVLDLRSLSATFGVRLDGILGYSAFDGVTLTVDFPARQLRVDRAPLGPVDGATVLRALRRNAPYVRAEIGRRRVDLLIDTGKSGGMTLDDLETFESEAPPTPVGTAVGISGSFVVRAARLRDDARLGGLVLRRPVAAASEGSSIIGSSSLRTLVLSFEPRARRVMIRGPGGSAPEPVEFAPVRGIGLGFKYDRGAWVVGTLFENSSAREAGVRESDLPLRINGRRLGELRCSRVEDLYTGESVSIEVIREFRDRLTFQVPVRTIVP